MSTSSSRWNGTAASHNPRARALPDHDLAALPFLGPGRLGICLSVPSTLPPAAAGGLFSTSFSPSSTARAHFSPPSAPVRLCLSQALVTCYWRRPLCPSRDDDEVRQRVPKHEFLCNFSGRSVPPRPLLIKLSQSYQSYQYNVLKSILPEMHPHVL